MSVYEGNSVVTTAVNGLHNDINREPDNVALKTEVSSFPPYVTSKNVIWEFPSKFLDDVSDAYYE